MGKWIVCVNQPYYPEVEDFDTYEEALEAYKKNLIYLEGSSSDIFLCEVKESQEFRGLGG